MKKVLFIVHEYYPYGSAITNCLKPIIDEMNNQEIMVSILTRRTHQELKKYEIIDNVEIFRINDLFNIYNNKVNNSKNRFEKLYNKIILKLVWIYRTKIKKENEGFLNIEKSIKLGKKILKNNNYDTIISCSYPFAMHKIAKELKNEFNIKWVAYQFDPHTYNHTLDNKIVSERLEEEINTFKNVDKIFLPKENYEENLKTDLKELKEKYYPIDFALIKKIDYKKLANNKKIIFTFTGTFYDDIRTPYDMFNFFENINLDYELHLYYIAEKSMNDSILEYQKKFKKKLVLHFNRPKEECDIALKNSDIIINIGNRIKNQTPSKIFEYISLGKPIVNFYNIDEDTSKKVLNKYPLVLNIHKDFKTEDIKKFEEFCLANKNRLLTWKEIKERYKTAEDIAKEFIKEVNNCDGK